MSIKKLNIALKHNSKTQEKIGVLLENNRKIYFEYDKNFIKKRINISPFKLKLTDQLQEHKESYPRGNFGVFDDSLPDGWGMLLMDRYFRKNNIDLQNISSLDRLAYISDRAMGNLIYYPADYSYEEFNENIDLFKLSKNVNAILGGKAEDILPVMLNIGGSPGGARPKILVGYDGANLISESNELNPKYEHWLIKFNSNQDFKDLGKIEYVYYQMAKKAGLNISTSKLFFDKNNDGYFGTKRFDRDKDKRYHIHTLANLIHANFRIPSLDYELLIKVCLTLTQNNKNILEIFKLMLFNVLSYNRDDHGKNFSFFMNNDGKWSFAPVYDLTFSYGPGNEHSTTIAGEGKSPTIKDIKKIAESAGITEKQQATIIEEVKNAISFWSKFASDIEISKENIKLIQKYHNNVNKNI